MRRPIVFGLATVFLLGAGCASRTMVVSGESETTAQGAPEAQLFGYDRQEERFQFLYDKLLERQSQAPQLIEARALASVAEEFYVLAEYETAMEVLREAIMLLEEKLRSEEIPF
jgi:hypothetical protein